MQQKTITLYEYSELSKPAKDKALADYRERDFDTYSLQVFLDNEFERLLAEHSITPTKGEDGYDSKYGTLHYSLSCSQGDGVCFSGEYLWDKYTIYITHSGRYTHSYSTSIEMQESDNLGIHIEDEDEDAKRFEAVYQAICKELEKLGYQYIEDMESEAHFIEECNANEWTFREDGTRESIDQ